MFASSLFQQSLQDLVKGLRSNRRTESVFIQEKLVSLAGEARSSDPNVKSTAVLKLAYLQMLGYPIKFAAFPIIETISNPSFPIKRIGYLAAAQSFSPTTDVLLLATNQFKKDLTSGRLQDCSQALTCLAKLINKQLGQDVEHDLEVLLKSPRPYIRKKALLVLFRLISVHEDALPVAGPRLRDLLSDPDPSVVCAAVTVICELVRKAPSAFLPLVPTLYGLLTTSKNNWMLIKIVSLFGVLTPLEPRLARKLLPHLMELMKITRAKSLLYECCSTVTLGMTAYQEAVDLCAMRLGEFLVDKDQNLKYLGLICMARLIKSHRNAAIEHRDLILDCLDDEDISIRMRALDLVSELVSKRSLRDLSAILLRKLKASCKSEILSSSSLDFEAPYRAALAHQLLKSGRFARGLGYRDLESADDFRWYLAQVLGGLARIDGLPSSTAATVADQLTEIATRVEDVQETAVDVSMKFLREKFSGDKAKAPSSIVASAAWIAGEHASLVKEKAQAVSILLNEHFANVSDEAQVRLMMAAVKIVARITDSDRSPAVFETLRSCLAKLCESDVAPTQERARLLSGILDGCSWNTYSDLLNGVFEGSFIPVDSQAQRRVPVPEGLDLDAPMGVVDFLDEAGNILPAYNAGLIEELEREQNGSMFRERSRTAEGDLLLEQGGPTDPRARNPFYLSGEAVEEVTNKKHGEGSSTSSALRCPPENDHALPTGAKAKVYIGEAIIKDDRDGGVDRSSGSNVDGGQQYAKAFEGLFGAATKERSGRGKKKTKRKKGKRKKARQEVNLIDLGEPEGVENIGNIVAGSGDKVEADQKLQRKEVDLLL